MGNRWISYIYRYKENQKCENAGYIKVVRTGSLGVDEAKLDIGIKLVKPIEHCCRIYAIYGGCSLHYIHKFIVQANQKDAIIVKKTIPWKDLYGDDYGNTKQEIGLGEFDGLFFEVDDGDTLVGLWNERDINVKHFINNPLDKKISMDSKDNWEQNNNTKIYEKTDNSQIVEDEINYSEQTRVTYNQEFQAMNPIEHILNTHIKLPQFIDSPFKECVKLVPQDIGMLPMGNWKLGQNSFLTHGYYRYKYIMLGKVSFNNKETYVLGVPGVYTNKEKYLANMFGFSLFIPVKKSDIKSGSFGYWVWEVIQD